MAQTYNILMNRFNGTTHDTLLPKNHLEGTSNPTTSTVGIVGQFYLNTATKQLFQCSTVSGSIYTWVPFYNATQTLDNTTKAKYGLASTATPNDAFNSLATNMVATRKTYPVKAGNVVSAGDVVDVVGGKVQKTGTPVPNSNTKTVFDGSTTDDIYTFKLNDTYSVVMYSTNGTYGYFRLINNSTGVLAGTQTAYSPEDGNYVGYVSGARLSDTKFCVSFQASNSLYVRVISVSGTTFTLGGVVSAINIDPTYNTIVPLSDTSFVLIYNRAGLKSKVCTVSNNTITVGGTEYSLTGSTASSKITASRITNASNNNKRVCACYANATLNGEAVVITIDSNNAVIWGTPVIYEGGSNGSDGNQIREQSCASVGDEVVVTYAKLSKLRAKCLTIGETSIFAGAQLEITGNTREHSLVYIGSNRFVLNYANWNGSSAIITKNETTLVIGAPFVFNSGLAMKIFSCAVHDDKVLVCYSDGENSYYGTSTILTARGDSVGNLFTNTSSQAIALQSGTAGQSIDIIYDGVAPLSGITAGTQITSAGVQGYAPQDGWLWVKPEWDKKPFVTGMYVGNDAATREISLGFKPSAVLLYRFNGKQWESNTAIQGGFALDGYPCLGTVGNNATRVLEVTTNGFNVFANGSYYTNQASTNFYYIAFR